jgi:adenine/guanine phosphoribosyltransferase-like PRPP-binding protein
MVQQTIEAPSPRWITLSSKEAIQTIESSSVSAARRSFMIATVQEGQAYWHDFGDGRPVCILDVSSFFNHGVNVPLMDAVVKEVAQQLQDVKPTIGLTAASSGNIFTYALCKELGIGRMIYATKKPNVTQEHNGFLHTDARSYTGGEAVDLAMRSSLIPTGARVLVTDDFADTGKMAVSLVNLIDQAGAYLEGFAFGVNKPYAGGESKITQLLNARGLSKEHMASFITIDRMDQGVVQFHEFPFGFRLMQQEEY